MLYDVYDLDTVSKRVGIHQGRDRNGAVQSTHMAFQCYFGGSETSAAFILQTY